MARTKSDRVRSKTQAVDDLTQSIGQLQSFIPKLEDLGREGFPYLEGALTRTELQLRECIKRAFGEKSPEFQRHRHLKLSLTSSEEKNQTLSLIRNLITSLEDKKSELQGLKPAAPEPTALPSNPPHVTLVPPAVTAAPVSVTSATSTPGPTAATLHLVTDIDRAPQPAIATAAPSAPAGATSPSVVEPAHTAPASPVRHLRAPLEPISSLFRTQETRVQAPAPAPSPDAAPVSTSPTPLENPAPTTARAADSPEASASLAQNGDTEVPLPAWPSVSPVATPAAAADMPVTGNTDHLSTTRKLCQRFHMVARQLRLRGEYRQTVNIEDEFDVQDLAHALLRLHFDDIGTDEWNPSYTNGASRMTFLLDHDRLALVVKKTRAGLSGKELTDQLREDVERYRGRGRCTHLLCFVYDPEGRIGNPSMFERQLSTSSEHFTVDVVVAPK